ncbi:MAG: hypothetical protein QOJ44_2231 [Acidimicrobiaceae bacterium]|nr:hypothetical protein [Acidimicrobiaceae bacterium]
MAIIWPCALSVEAYARAGKRVRVPRPRCVICEGQMIFWSGYFRSVRAGEVFRIWVRRARCESCRRSEVLLPSFCLVGRLDAVGVIGPAVTAVGAGAGTRLVAGEIDEHFAYTTVRGWWRRHRQRVEVLVGWLAAIVAARGLSLPRPCGVAEADALEGLKAVAGPVSAAFGIGLWSAVSLVTAGRWLSKTTTDTPLAGEGGRRLMTAMATGQPRRPP